MRCAILFAENDLRVQELDQPRPGNFQVLVKVAVCGVCHTDAAILDGSWPVPTLPCVMGHEYCGTIERVGEHITGVREGDRVAVNPYQGCGNCTPCRRGLDNLCLNRRWFQGGYAEYAVLPESSVYKLPENVSDLTGSMGEPASACLHAVEQADVKPGDTVVVVGGGTMGLTIVQMARLAGAATIILSEPNRMRRELGCQLGADLGVDPYNEDLDKIVSTATNGIGADCALEAVGMAQTIEQCLPLVRKGGIIVVAGVTHADDIARIKTFDLMSRGLTLRGAMGRPADTFERTVRLLPFLNLEPLFTHEFTLENVHAAIAHTRSGDGIKGFIRP